MNEAIDTDEAATAGAAPAALTLLGDVDAAACEGDYCVIPPHHTQAVVNRRVDADAV